MATMSGSAPWNGQDSQIMQGTEDDFQNFLDMNGIPSLSDQLQFDFGDFQDPNSAAHVVDNAQRSRVDTSMTGADISAIHAHAPSPAVPTTMVPITTSPGHQAALAPIFSPSNDAILEIDAKIQYLQTQRNQFEQRRLEEQQAAFFAHQSRMVPPTPQSAELRGSAGQMFPSNQGQSQQQPMYDRFQQLKEQQDLSLTPLVSPAVTPLETHFPEPQYTVPGAYNFSPLSSPAIQSQNDAIASYGQHLVGITVNPPTEMQIDSPVPATAPNDLAKKARKANVSGAKSRSKASVRQSPITKPQRKRTASTPNIAKHIISEIEQASASGSSLSQLPLPAPAQSAISTDTSEDGSVSPETITDMPPPPPPQPRSARQSPYIQPQRKKASTASTNLSPATPASLMKLPSPSLPKTASISSGPDFASESIDSLELPESVASSKPQPTIITQSPPEPAPASEHATPKSANLPPLPSHSSANSNGIASSSPSPVIAAGSSSRKTPTIAPRGSKKRSSASVQVSPALRPKISPSIKPLLPGGGGMSAEDAAMLTLSQKSNYQNILEGNSVPGISYPTELSTNLTSKRTSHKIAEQGRRNRINSALQEIATLLPTDEGKAESSGGGGKKETKASSAPSSKANTVELAIQYIKQLQQQIESEKERADGAELRAKEAEEKLQMLNTNAT